MARSFEEIAKIRGRLISAVMGMMTDLVERGKLQFKPDWVDAKNQATIEAACARLGYSPLTLIKETLPPEPTFGEIRMMTTRIRSPWERRKAGASGRDS
jgi:hypothetical protein